MPDAELHFHAITARGRESGGGATDACFPYWSFTKTVIAISAAKLSDAGVLDLDAAIAGEQFTVRQLLSHTAGLPDYGSLPEYHRAVAAGDDPWPRDRMIEAVLSRGPLFTPGEGWSYSNIGYMLARERIEAASGVGFGRLVDETIRRPLGLDSIALATTREQFSRLHWPAARHYHPGWVYHGCLTGTARDAAALLHALWCGRLLGERGLAEMLVRRPLGGAIPGRPWTECGYGLGLMSGRMGDAGRAIGHSGGGPFCVNAVYHFPDRDEPVTVACFTDGTAEGRAEFEAVAVACTGRPSPGTERARAPRSRS
ncbi:serine hydrolase domain-containing protein [Rhodovulum sp. PH10]|uniref:serine hydrolase domain-containing protein n=1 Tax=Rhodovulum sp. PH10 TaxID=1187851 RepID=UPI00068AD45D|nr:serine hydrolase domain-containing protein [Rhodovulum sp. PH10]